MNASKRAFLRGAGLLVADGILARKLAAWGRHSSMLPDHKVILVVFGGVRRQETFSREGLQNIPHLSAELAPQSLFFRDVRNEGVTAHFNAISSILTGTWQRVGDWGENPPATPTLAEYFRKELNLPPSEVWIVASNKALTGRIGASASKDYGSAFGASVVFPKQLMIDAVVDALRRGKSRDFGDRQSALADIESMLEGENYEGLGWNVFDAAARLDPRVRETLQGGISTFVHANTPTTGDELTFFIGREIMRKFAPALMVMVFSDVEVAHFGSYSLHLAGIQNTDRICSELWHEVSANPESAGKTTVVILPEFGRDPDGSTTNGFFNHRSFDASCRSTWMMALGEVVGRPQVIERPIRHIDLCPTLASLLGCRSSEASGQVLRELQG